jgi:hypothetical protein
MMLPEGDRAQVDRAKITDYLLSLSHPDGRGKAAFFMLFGFRIEQLRNPAMADTRSGDGGQDRSVATQVNGL